ncbi:FtsX-like permease family protein [Frigoriglobus tundricola]|uniref:Uncharacterized protein n=1 Tax=Frigoriglobus tundricola TaxID=2774151 RepID=A0A6M5Z6Q3_9BACT|nr:FtsX-like permease family protein [Frigoriglobus tundricola]QJX01292.1 hypothetical protein FTUN_8934 [Frigoriglobus tundricola]
MGLWKYAVRDLIRRPGRSLFTLTGIAVGVAAAIAALAATQAARGHYRALFDSVAGRSALEVYAPGEAGFDPAAAADRVRVPGVQEAVPEVRGTGGLPSWYSSAAVIVRSYRATDGAKAPRDDEALVPTHLLEAHGLKPGGRLRLWGTTGRADLVVAPAPPSAPGSAAGSCVIVSLATAQHLFGLGAHVNIVRLVLEDGADPQTVRSAIASRLPPGLCVREPAERGDITGGLRAAATQGLTGLTAIALAGAGYIVFGLAQLNLLARRPELALLRTLGASTRQVEGLFLRNALLLGFGGGVLGTAGGWLLAWGVLGGAGRASGIAIAAPRVSGASVLLGLGSGVAISMCAVWFPARSLCRAPPLDLIRAGTVTGGAGRPSMRVTAAAALGPAVGLWLLADGATGRIPPAWGRVLFPPALALVLAGTTGLVTVRLPRLVARLERPARALFGIEGVIAVRQLGLRPDRTARTCGVVFVTVTMVVGFGHTVLNTLSDVRAWTDRAIPAHLLVRGAPPDPGLVLNVGLPESIGADLRGLSGVANVEQIAFLSITVNGSPALLLARTFASDEPLPIDLRGAEPEHIRDGLANGETVLADGLATHLRARAGDSIVLDTPAGPRTLHVAGVVTEYAAGGRAMYLDWKTTTSLFGNSGVHVFLVTLTAGGSAEAEVARYCAARGLFLQRNREFRQTVNDLTRGLTGGLWALLAVMMAVAGLGVANAVAVVAQEQRADVRTLQVIGMSTGRIRRAFRLQTALLTLAGVPCGVFCGIGLAVVLGRTVRGLWGYGVPFEIQWEFLLWSVGNAILVAVLAGFALPLLSRTETA